jgi:hypothetical protein
MGRHPHRRRFQTVVVKSTPFDDCNTKSIFWRKIMATELKPVEVLTDCEAGPYIMTPVQYVDQIREFLEKRRIRFNIDRRTYKTQRFPEFTAFNISRDTTDEQVAEISDFLCEGMFAWELNQKD